MIPNFCAISQEIPEKVLDASMRRSSEFPKSLESSSNMNSQHQKRYAEKSKQR